MKLRWNTSAGLLALTLLAAIPASAQEAPPYRALKIPLPEKAQVSVEVDAHEEDLVGVVKSLLKGLNLPALMRMSQGIAGPAGIAFPDITANGEALPGAPAPAPVPAPGHPEPPAPNFAEILKNVHQLHMVVFKAEGFTPEQAIKFYEQPFMEEGGRRVLWVNQGDTRMLMMGFSKPRGFAIVVPTATEIMVIRADGYPDLEGVGSFVTMLATMVGSMRSTMSDIFSDMAAPEATPGPAGAPGGDFQVFPETRPQPRVIRRRPAHLVAPKPAAKKAPAKAPVRKK